MKNEEKVFYYKKGPCFCDALGNTLYKIEVEKKFLRKKKINIKQMDGSLAATIKKTGFIFSQWKIKIPDEPDMSTCPGIISSYTIDSKGREIAKIWDEGTWWEERPKVRIKSGQNDALILAITEVLSRIYAEEREEREKNKEELRELERHMERVRMIKLDRQRGIL